MSNRYDAAEHLRAWKATGTFPRIHDQIAGIVADVVPAGRTLVDLGASTGLLTVRLRAAGYRVLSVEGEPVALAAGQRAGTYADGRLIAGWITPATLTAFDARLGETLAGETAVIVARRVFPELYSALGADFPTLVEILARHADLLINESRVVSSRTRHPLGTPAAENAALADWWRLRPGTNPDVHVHDRLRTP